MKVSTESILENLRVSTNTLQVNFERLLDYQSQLIFYGLGQLRDQLQPTESEARALVQMDPGSGSTLDVEKMRAELQAIPKLLQMEEKQTPSIEMLEWHHDASEKLTDSVAAVFAASNASSAVAATQDLVQRFVARRKLRLSRTTAPRPQLIQETTSKKTKVVRHYMNRHSQELKSLSRLVGTARSAVLGQSLLEKSEQSSLVYIRWNQLHAALTEAHRKHSVFADSKKRALRVAKEALRAAEGYIHCQGQDVADLQLQWQRAIRLQDQVGTALLEAWASTSAANEILETFTNQGLLQDIAAAAAIHPEPTRSPCPAFESLVQVAYRHGVQATDAVLSNVLTQVLVLHAIGTYQKKELKRMKLEVTGGTASSAGVSQAMLALHAVASNAALGTEALHVTARALDVVGPALCPAPENGACAGTILKANSTEPSIMLTALKPGDILLQKNPVSMVKACLSNPPSNPMSHMDLKMEHSKLVAEKSESRHAEPHTGEAGSSIQSKLLEKLEQMEEEIREIHSEMNEMKSMKEEKVSSVGPALLQSEAAEAANFLHSLCEGDCLRSFQQKLEKGHQASFLREFTGWWIRRDAESG